MVVPPWGMGPVRVRGRSGRSVAVHRRVWSWRRRGTGRCGGLGGRAVREMPLEVMARRGSGQGRHVYDRQCKRTGEQGAGGQSDQSRPAPVRDTSLSDATAHAVDMPHQKHGPGRGGCRRQREHGRILMLRACRTQSQDHAAGVGQPCSLPCQASGAHTDGNPVCVAVMLRSGMCHRNTTNAVARSAIATMPKVRSLTRPSAGNGTPCAMARWEARQRW